MATDALKQVRAYVRDAHDHIQISDADRTDPNIIEALADILSALRVLAKEADDADTAIRRMGQP